MKMNRTPLSGEPVDFTDTACSAIEGWAARRRPEARNSLWVAKVPTRDWGYDPFRWLREIGEIQREFERLIGFAIPLTATEKRRTAELTLLKTMFVLVRKAEAKSGQTLLKALLG
jgi:hypothetical protein